MFDLLLGALLISGSHVAVAYGAAEVWKLEYKMYLAATIGVSLVVALLLKVTTSQWKNSLKSVISQEYREGELPIDVILALLVLVAGSIVSAYIVYRRYGILGWAGAFVSQMGVSWIV